VTARRRSPLLVAAVLVAVVGTAAAQGTQPLRKSDLVRLLSTGTLPTADLVRLIRRNCLAFTPSERDRRDLQAVGADAGVLAAVDACARGGARAAATPRPGGTETPARTAAITLTGPRAPVRVVAGGEVRLDVQARRDRRAASRVALVLRGSAAVTSEAADVAATTDARGVASFAFTARVAAGRYQVAVEPADAALRGRLLVDLVVDAGAAAQVAVEPRRIELRADSLRYPVTLRVTDALGNPLAGLDVALRPRAPGLLVDTVHARTDERGVATLTLRPAAADRGGAVAVLVNGRELGAVDLAAAPAPPAPGRLAFVEGAGQRPRAGAPLAQSFRVLVTDSSGLPMEGQRITLSGDNLRPLATVAVTDSSGYATVVATAGLAAGRGRLVATLGRLTARVDVNVTAGPPVELHVSRSGSAVTELAAAARGVLTLAVTGRDAFGNAAAVGALRARTLAARVARVAGFRIAGDTTLVTVEYRGTGSTLLVLEADRLNRQLPVRVDLPAGGAWSFGVRGSWVAFDYTFAERPNVRSYPGQAVDLFLRRSAGRRWAFALGATIGSVSADSIGGRRIATSLVEATGRLDFALAPDARVVPVLSAVGGVYRLQSDEVGALVYHTFLTTGFGGGVDVPLGRSLTLDVRATYQVLLEHSEYVSGVMGSLIPVGVGLRLVF
jgi:hypothetical protein